MPKYAVPSDLPHCAAFLISPFVGSLDDLLGGANQDFLSEMMVKLRRGKHAHPNIWKLMKRILVSGNTYEGKLLYQAQLTQA